MKTEKEIAEHNQALATLIRKIEADSARDIAELRKQLVAPCQLCKYDGQWRCETCEERFYEGCNIADYPQHLECIDTKEEEK